jgi:putative membrane protein
MKNPKWGVAAIVATLALAGPAWAQSSGSQMGTGGQSAGGESARGSGSGEGSSSSTGPSSSQRPGSDSASEHGTGSSADQTTGDNKRDSPSQAGQDRSSGSTSSSGSSAQGTGSGTMSQGSSARSGEGGAGKMDKKLEEAAQKLHASNQAEIHMGQMGVQNAQSPEVKQYAQKLVDEHQKNDQELQQLAQSKGINLQGEAFQKKQEKAQDHMKDLQGKTGAEFDKEYVKMMKKEHERDVKDVEKAAKDARKGKQTELASFLEQTHASLQGHLKEAERLEKSVGQSERRQARRPSDTTGRSGDTSGTGTSGSGTTSGSGDTSGTRSGSTGGSSGTGGTGGTGAGSGGTGGSGGGGSGGSGSGGSGGAGAGGGGSGGGG